MAKIAIAPEPSQNSHFTGTLRHLLLLFGAAPMDNFMYLALQSEAATRVWLPAPFSRVVVQPDLDPQKPHSWGAVGISMLSSLAAAMIMWLATCSLRSFRQHCSLHPVQVQFTCESPGLSTTLIPSDGSSRGAIRLRGHGLASSPAYPTFNQNHTLGPSTWGYIPPVGCSKCGNNIWHTNACSKYDVWHQWSLGKGRKTSSP